MYDTLLQVAHDIIVIGGALMIILGVVLLMVLIFVAFRLNKVVSKSMETVSTVSEYILLPFTYLASIFSGILDDKPSRKVTSKKK